MTGRSLTIWLCALITLVISTTIKGEESLSLRNGVNVRGGIFELPSMNKNAFAAAGGGVKARPILVIDDGIRQIHVYRRGMVLGDPKSVRGIEKTIKFDFKSPLSGQAVNGIGALLGVSPFNEFARRAVLVRGPKGESLSILQGIEELNSRYAIVKALKDRPSYIWEMRVATSSIKSQTLRSIFKRRLMQPNLTPDQDFNMRLEHVRFFIDAERFNDARETLREALKLHPGEAEMEKMLIRITEREAKELIDEAVRRADVGQETFARKVLSTFRPEKVGRLVQLQVKDAIAKLDDGRDSVRDAIAKLDSQAQQLPPGKSAPLDQILKEIRANLTFDTLPRLGDFLLQSENGNIPTDSRVALGVSGWLLGKGSGIQNLNVATSMIQVRNLVFEYLGSDNAGRRKAILSELANLEGAEPEYIDKMLPLMPPPKVFPPESSHPEIPGMFTIGNEAVDPVQPRYQIQLPPDYHPLRQYPCIVALHPPQGTPEQQLQWWAGHYDSNLGFRNGHATRHGYIVVAPLWTRPGQRVYEYTPREHQQCLIALRDAMRRASIDADRIFLVGHADGATAAWDIAMSHPDIWAGMIAISSDPGKTITHYFPNAKHVPIYTVNGQLDRVQTKNNAAFTSILDDYANVHNDAMFVVYRGWGFSFFFEEIHYLFDWMNTSQHHRKDMPQEIDNVTMRHGDEFFWWLELNGLKDGTAVNPILWDYDKRSRETRIRAKKVEATIGANNTIRISQAPTERYTIWMRPGMGVDLNEQIVIKYGQRPIRHEYDGSIHVMLEDARQRADRKRPFWTKKILP